MHTRAFCAFYSTQKLISYFQLDSKDQALDELESRASLHNLHLEAVVSPTEVSQTGGDKPVETVNREGINRSELEDFEAMKLQVTKFYGCGTLSASCLQYGKYISGLALMPSGIKRH